MILHIKDLWVWEPRMGSPFRRRWGFVWYRAYWYVHLRYRRSGGSSGSGFLNSVFHHL
jgi:hypothetical protein